MVQLGITVGVANIILWAVIEVFLLLITNTATSLIARHSVNNRLLSNQTIDINAPRDRIDDIPYNGDLFLAPKGLKLLLTLYRIVIIAISIYVGANLDGEREIADQPFQPPVSSILMAPDTGPLTSNSGEDMHAMAKLSCLRILDNNNVVLYKGFVSNSPSEDILCEDGTETKTKNILLRAEIRSTLRTPLAGLDISALPIFDSKFENQEAEAGLDRGTNRLVVNATNEAGELTNIATRVVLTQELPDGMCRFGIWRSPGNGFQARVDLSIEAPCTLQIPALDRLLFPKPEFLPPRMSFLYQFVDSVVVERRVDEAPAVLDDNIVAVLPLRTIIVMVVFAMLSTIVGIMFGVVIKRGKVRPDLSSAKGIGDVLNGPSCKKNVRFRWNEESQRVICDEAQSLKASSKAVESGSVAKDESVDATKNGKQESV